MKKNRNVCKIFIIENSNNKILKKKISKLRKKNIKIILSKNIGYASAANLACKYINTKYFVLINPDVVGIDLKNLKKFLNKVKNINDFGAIGPRFVGKNHKNLIQTSGIKEIEKIKCISGAVMFFDTRIFKKLNGFDKNFFLYFEENDYCLRAVKKNYTNYQINSIKMKHENGKSVNYTSEKDKFITSIIRTWHFSWSKIYFLRKNYGFSYAFFVGLTGLIRSFIKMNYYKFQIQSKKYIKYHARCNAILASLTNKGSNFRSIHVKKKYDI